MEKAIKVFLTILFFLNLFDVPYGFYQFVRFAALLGFAILAYRANKQQYKTEMIIYVCLAILFQPLLKISLSRDFWNIANVIGGVYLIITIFSIHKNIHYI